MPKSTSLTNKVLVCKVLKDGSTHKFPHGRLASLSCAIPWGVHVLLIQYRPLCDESDESTVRRTFACVETLRSAGLNISCHDPHKRLHFATHSHYGFGFQQTIYCVSLQSNVSAHLHNRSYPALPLVHGHTNKNYPMTMTIIMTTLLFTFTT